MYSADNLQVAANAARDVGGRLAAMTIWGKAAAGSPGYAAIAALTNIPATLFGAFLYEIFMVDSDRVMPRAQREFMEIHQFHGRNGGQAQNSSGSFNEKAEVSHA
jgi:hypothetical protein